MYVTILVPLDGAKLGEATLPNVENLVLRPGPPLKVTLLAEEPSCLGDIAKFVFKYARTAFLAASGLIA